MSLDGDTLLMHAPQIKALISEVLTYDHFDCPNDQFPSGQNVKAVCIRCLAERVRVLVEED